MSIDVAIVHYDRMRFGTFLLLLGTVARRHGWIGGLCEAAGAERCLRACCTARDDEKTDLALVLLHPRFRLWTICRDRQKSALV